MSIKIVVKERPTTVPADLRLFRRMVMVLIFISRCTPKKSADLQQAHFLNSIFLNEKIRNDFLNYYTSDKLSRYVEYFIDPYLTRSINYAVGYGFIDIKKTKTSNRFFVTASGIRLIAELENQNAISDLIETSKTIGKITSETISKLVEGL